MSGKIFPIISSIILIAIFAVLFNLSLPKIEDFFIKEQTLEISASKINGFFKSLSQTDKEILQSLPCKVSDKCSNTEEIRKKFDLVFKADSIKRVLILTQSGTEIFSNRDIDAKYNSLITQAQNLGEVYFREGSMTNLKKEDKVITVQKLSKVVNDQAFGDKFALVLFNKEKVNILAYRTVFGLVMFTPIILALLYFVIQNLNAGKIKERLMDENQNYLSQIELLKKENIQQSQFLANFTHELRTPLNSIIGFSGLLKDQTLGQLGNAEYIKYANDINTSGAHLLSLINDILDYSKSEVGKLKVNITEVDIIKVIKQSLSIIAPRASESNVDLLQSFAGDYLILRIDPKRLKQIMLNLLSNSVKFTPEGGNVMVSVFPDIKNERVSIEVKDTGVGIAEKDIPTVMSLFGQVETDLNRKYEGTGIGLPFAKKLTQLMGGTFDLQSKVAVGTKITLTFNYDKKLNAEYAALYKKST